MKTVSLAVAKYREDVGWLSEVGVPYHVYDKGGGPTEWQALPNVGREAQTYLHHCLTHYHDLTDIVVFSQGDPLDHAPDFLKSVSSLVNLAKKNRLSQITPYLDLCKKYMGHLVRPRGWVRPLFTEFAPRFLGGPMREGYYFHGSGALFAVKKEAILQRSLADYMEAEEWVLKTYRSPWIMELVWAYFFGLASEPGSLLDKNPLVATMTVNHPKHANLKEHPL